MGDAPSEKPKYPRSVFFIVVNEFCERFTFYGLRTVLSIYFVSNLIYTENTATVMYHAFVVLCYFFPVCGAIIADSWLGKFKTILYLSIVYCGGSILLSVASSKFGVKEGQHSTLEESLALLGLLFIAIGTGGIKPCVSAFGGDQFKLPEQLLQLSQFFSIFYFSINAGSVISTFVTPIFRQDVKCFGHNSCFPLAFGVPALVMVIALTVFVLGKPRYKVIPAQGNMLVRVCGCIGSAIAGRRKRDPNGPNKRWIDYADQNKYDQELRDDVISVLKVLVLSLPLPLFWALYDQQGSRWTFQALNMNGWMGAYVIKPDQMQVVNPVLILLLLPFMEVVVYPLCTRFRLIRKPLQRMVTGMVLAAISFFVSALLEYELEGTYPVPLSKDLAQIRIFNVAPYPVTIESDSFNSVDLPAMEMHAELALKATDDTSLELRVTGKNSSKSKFDIPLKANSAHSMYLFNDNGNVTLIQASTEDTIAKTSDIDPVVRFVYSFSDGKAHELQLRHGNSIGASYSVSSGDKFNAAEEITGVPIDTYDLQVDDNVVLSDVVMDVSGTYTLLINEDSAKIFAIRRPSKINILWQLPQYIIISVAEVMFSVTGLHFFFTQAPISMKSVVSSIWLLTTAFGNLIVMTIAEFKFSESQVYEFLLFAFLMLADTGIFLILAIRYKYRDVSADEAAAKTPDAKAAEGSTPKPPAKEEPGPSEKK